MLNKKILNTNGKLRINDVFFEHLLKVNKIHSSIFSLLCENLSL
jgi:hypothetical protein